MNNLMNDSSIISHNHPNDLNPYLPNQPQQYENVYVPHRKVVLEPVLSRNAKSSNLNQYVKNHIETRLSTTIADQPNLLSNNMPRIRHSRNHVQLNNSKNTYNNSSTINSKVIQSPESKSHLISSPTVHPSLGGSNDRFDPKKDYARKNMISDFKELKSQ
eukprot:CAMPEP_0116897088 /NCGR_PEP_ID=MMETSP0467-20121206/6177_1 /TAXON_ID=283647 /ORGANISM="Mesodinium pulex, Strain SPMC105" /LENGTH=159 /DNA_ID=CAMNT_0004568599 /DNA_START=219 /DNA_END=698 /DNA_ORIENTATION=+